MSSEAANQQIIRLEAARRGICLWRNNVGACMTDEGRQIRFGLGNDSAKLNRVFKSSDLIGITPVTITQEMVGSVIGQFVAIEVKADRWKPSENDKRYVAQRNFGREVIKQGGYFTFAQKPEHVWTL
jgi:hypothetical protein